MSNISKELGILDFVLGSDDTHKACRGGPPVGFGLIDMLTHVDPWSRYVMGQAVPLRGFGPYNPDLSIPMRRIVTTNLGPNLA